ncbi:MAG: ASCH domain-containing protein [Clostridia bacterium]|nr:ASCH domain-containing protein [Clostridia bacterium]
MYVDLLVRQRTQGTVAPLGRQIVEHNMRLNPSPFEKINSGQKTIELRLFDEKRQQVQAGDKIVFTNSATGETLKVTVVKLHRFDTFDELYKALPLTRCGYTDENVDKATPADMEQYYSVEEQKKYGVVGIEFEITDKAEHP